MAIYRAETKPISRKDGRSAIAAAAYRSGSALVDERTGNAHDYTRRSGVAATGIVTPDGLGCERNALWNGAEAAEKRKDGRTAREWVLALPAELDDAQRLALVDQFSRSLAERFGVAVDFAIHRPGKEGDERNHHAHVLTTTRQVERGADGGLVFGGKALPEQSDSQLRKQGIKSGAELVHEVRALWETQANAALEAAGSGVRIDRRSLQAQGANRAPTVHLGPCVTLMERRGVKTEAGNLNRAIEQDNAQRAVLSAEIVDLQAERQKAAEQAKEARRAAQAAEDARRAAEEARRAAQAREQAKFRREVEADADLIEREGGYLVARERWEKQGGLRIFVRQLPEFEQYAKPCREAEDRAKVLEQEISQAQQRIAQAETDEAEWKAEHPWKALIDLTPEPIERAREQVKRDRIAIEEKCGLLAVVKESLTKLVGAFRKFFADALERPDIKRRGMVREKALQVAEEKWGQRVRAEQAAKRAQEAQRRQAEQVQNAGKAVALFREAIADGLVTRIMGDPEQAGALTFRVRPLGLGENSRMERLVQAWDNLPHDQQAMLAELLTRQKVEQAKPTRAQDDFEPDRGNGPGL